MTTDELLAKLTNDHAERRNAAGLQRDAAVADATQTDLLGERIAGIQRATNGLARIPIEPNLKWLDFLTTSARPTLCNELLALSPRVRDKAAMGRRQNLELSIRVIDRGLAVVGGTGYTLETLRLGQLMRDAGYVQVDADPSTNAGALPWFGCTTEVEHRLKKLMAERDQAQAVLDEAMLDDAEREQLAAADKIRRDALNARPTRKVRGDGSSYDKWPDGRCVEVEV